MKTVQAVEEAVKSTGDLCSSNATNDLESQCPTNAWFSAETNPPKRILAGMGAS